MGTYKSNLRSVALNVLVFVRRQPFEHIIIIIIIIIIIRIIIRIGDGENARHENAGLENAAQTCRLLQGV